ncbi:regulatory protein GemA [Variovorax sp. ZS18.2.2]|uniref:regulatory protein GemA n=1 Tax=Variovorax sp. ZS18.2.2 TaxID=2971255 RepID=UPI002151B253|nr:regulatory protein GemA [Variovorax sp. ZS18.2.2]MCR6480505.1 regulatory protein GemA [Variovorax sp. ZS18.2.2]
MSAERFRLIKLIHLACRELERAGKMDELTYRTMLRAAGGADSTKDMGIPALERVLARARKVRFVVRHIGFGRRRQDTRPEARKVRALWLFLHALGQVKNPSEEALARYVKRIAYIDDMHWADSLVMRRLIETMKKWAMRVLPGIVDGLRRTIDQAGGKDQLNEGQIRLRRQADKALRASDGFQGYWAAWMALNEALGIQFAADIAELGVRE